MNAPIPIPDPRHPDMSPEAIDQRLRALSQIYRLGMSLQGAKWIGPGEDSQSILRDPARDQTSCDYTS